MTADGDDRRVCNPRDQADLANDWLTHLAAVCLARPGQGANMPKRRRKSEEEVTLRVTPDRIISLEGPKFAGATPEQRGKRRTFATPWGLRPIRLQLPGEAFGRKPQLRRPSHFCPLRGAFRKLMSFQTPFAASGGAVTKKGPAVIS
jgi:hypothetical protein